MTIEPTHRRNRRTPPERPSAQGNAMRPAPSSLFARPAKDTRGAESRVAPVGALKILLIEDNPSDAFLVREYLGADSGLCFDLRHVESLAEARAALESFTPDVVLIDLSLPDSQGLDTFAAVRTWGGDFPVVILSGLDDQDVAVEAVRQGAQDYLPKNDINRPILTRVLRYAVERSRTERAIAAQERRWRAMIERSSDGIALVDENLRPTYISDSVRRSTGFEPEELLGKTMLDFVHPDDHGAIKEALLESFEHASSAPVSYRFRHKDGGWVWHEAVSTNLLNDPAVGAIIVNARDINDRKLAEAEVERHERVLQASIDSLPGLFYLLDEKLQYVLWNQNLQEITGRSAEELATSDPLEFVIEREHIAEAIGGLFSEGSAEADCHFLAANGEVIPYHFTGRRFMLDGKPYIVGMGLDMTERHQAQQQLEFQASLLAQVKNAVIATDEQGRVTYWNAFAEELYGWTEQEAIGRPIMALNVPESSVGEADAILADVAANGRWEGEFAVRRKDSSVFPSWTTLTTFNGKHGVAGFLGVSKDITERKQAEEERKALLGQLADRVKELGLLHEASLILQNEDQTLETVFEQIVERMPVAWRFPYETVARIRYEHAGDRFESASPEFRETPWMQASKFETAAGGRGVVEVGYLTEFPTADDGPFLHEERAVLDSLTQMLRAYLDRRHGRERNEILTADLSSQLSRVAALQKISEATLDGADLDRTLGVILEQAATELKVDAVGLLLFDAASQTLDYAAGVGFRIRDVEQTSLRLGEGLAGTCALRRKPIAIPDFRHPDASFVPQHFMEREGFVSCYSLPLIAKGRLQGSLSMFHRDRLDFCQKWRDVASDIGRQAAIAIDNAYLFENLQRSNLELQLSYDRTIEGWARALDLKDEETAGHSQRVTQLAIALAKELGINGEDLANIRRGALLHDIGKMGVPDEILLKPGQLDPDEWEVMKAHTSYGRDLLTGIPFLEPAVTIPYSHHEKWDGSGYPLGLKGEQIPFGARIFAVIDVFDALTNDRPYRKAWSRDKALAYIQDEAGKHFDPRVVEAFLRMLHAKRVVERDALHVRTSHPGS